METMEFRQSLFWDVNPKNIDPQKNAQYVIERILDFGTDLEVKWMWDCYDKALLKKNCGQIALFDAGNKKFMAADFGKQLNLDLDILPKETKVALDFLAGQDWLNENNNWYLAGGTALALQAGHRKSFDLGFFNKERAFDNIALIQKFSGIKEWEMTIKRKMLIRN